MPPSSAPISESWISSSRWLAIAAVVILAVVVVAGWAIRAVATEGTTTLDRAVLVEMAAKPNSGLAWLAEMISWLGNRYALGVLVLVITAALVLRGLFASAVWMLVVPVGAGLIELAAKVLVARPRPFQDPTLGLTAIDATALPDTSFPSGHATAALAVALAGGVVANIWTTRRWPLPLAVVLALVIGLTRPVLGVHYPSDVLAGWAVALVWWGACLWSLGWPAGLAPAPAKPQQPAETLLPPRSPLALPPSVVPTAPPLIDPPATLMAVYFTPGTDCLVQIVSLFESARRTVDVCVYTITDDRIASAMLAAHRRGVVVRVVTDDEKSRDPGSDIVTLRQAGVAVRVDDSPAHMHHKFAIFDGRVIVTGSFNWTRSASRYNQENIIVSDEPRLIASFAGQFEKLWRQYQAPPSLS